VHGVDARLVVTDKRVAVAEEERVELDVSLGISAGSSSTSSVIGRLRW